MADFSTAVLTGYEDGNDADALRRDPMFKLALDRLPSDDELCSQSTISRLENLPDTRAGHDARHRLIAPRHCRKTWLPASQCVFRSIVITDSGGR